MVGYSKGKLSSYSDEGNLLWTCEMHEGEICTVRFDSAHRFIFTLGVDRQIYLIEEKAPLQEHHLKHIVYNENISLMEISQKHCYLLLGSPDCKQVHVWDYDVVKLHKVIQLPEVPNFLLIEDALDLACLATVASRVYALQINKAKGGFTYQVVAVLLLNQLVALPAI